MGALKAVKIPSRRQVLSSVHKAYQRDEMPAAKLCDDDSIR